VARAADALQRALALDPADAGVLDRLVELRLRRGDAAGALEFLEARASSAEPSERARIQRRIAAVRRESLGDLPGAREALERAIAAQPLDPGALDDLLGLGDRDGVPRARTLTEANRRAQAALDRDPSRAEAYRLLERVASLAADADSAALAGQAAATVEGAEPALRAAIGEPSGELPGAILERAFGDGIRGAALDVWREAAPAAARLLGPELGDFGVGKGDRQDLQDPAWSSLARLARAVGAGQCALYLAPRADACLVAGDALVVGADSRGAR
jgi:hypothetical protein